MIKIVLDSNEVSRTVIFDLANRQSSRCPSRAHWLNATKSNQHPGFPNRLPNVRPTKVISTPSACVLVVLVHSTQGPKRVSQLIVYSARCACDRYLLTCIGESLNHEFAANRKRLCRGHCRPINEAIHFTSPRWSDLKVIK
jgi:hypothetical protein